MGKNILVFSDGTGQGGGVVVEERRSNVYKLYRATRSAPDTDISPQDQIAYYDPGLGSGRDREDIKFGAWRKLYNLLSKATGLGITQNIIDCYAFIIQHWEPGDRIYLYGFSRGAYTARCVGGVLAYCGVPTLENGTPIKRDANSARKIAQEAVVKVYQHGVGRKRDRLTEQRAELARNFRQIYSSNAIVDGKERGWSNEVPYLIGVWDTVAALGASWPKIILSTIVALSAISILLALLWQFGLLPTKLLNLSQGEWVVGALLVLLFLSGLIYLIKQLVFRRGLSVPWWQTLHLRKWKMEFYDPYLNPRVQYAKHALSVDENRAAFKQVPWIDNSNSTRSKKANDWFQQVWFAGVHSDIGGSYPETESRLSDIALNWMVECSLAANYPIKIDKHYLRIYPVSNGVQHDERKSAWFSWKLGIRSIPDDAPLHMSVTERFEAPGVIHFDEVQPYRPDALKRHKSLKKYYKDGSSGDA